MCLPYHDEDEDEEAEEPVAPQKDQAINMLDKMLSGDAISDLSSDTGSEAAFDGGISDNSSCSSPSKVSRYIIPMRRKPREPGLPPVQQGLSQVHNPVCPPTSPQMMRIGVHVQSVLDGNLRGCSQMTGNLDISTPLLPTRCKIMCHKVR